jgi:FkbM family methyltransferase
MRPAMAHPFPKRWKVFAKTVNNAALAPWWQGAGLRWTRSKTDGYLMPCDLTVFSGRIAWFFRRWYEIDTQSVLRTLLPPGGTFIDIGANIGMASLSARRAIGERGLILAFEPQPRIAAIYCEAMRRNGIANAELVNAALSDVAGTIEFFSPHENHGEGHVGSQPDGRPGQHLTVEVVDGSRLDALDRIDVVKIDVEGHEAAVLRAIDGAIKRFRPMVLCELMGEHLLRAGTRPREILTRFSENGYAGFSIGLGDDGLLRQRARLEPLRTAPDDISCNALFVPSEQAEEISGVSFVALPK